MAQNKLTDLNNHLFAQLERLNDDSLSAEEVKKESIRAKAMTGVASQVLKSARLSLEALKMIHKGDLDDRHLPETFGVPKQITQ